VHVELLVAPEELRPVQLHGHIGDEFVNGVFERLLVVEQLHSLETVEGIVVEFEALLYKTVIQEVFGHNGFGETVNRLPRDF